MPKTAGEDLGTGLTTHHCVHNILSLILHADACTQVKVIVCWAKAISLPLDLGECPPLESQ